MTEQSEGVAARRQHNEIIGKSIANTDPLKIDDLLEIMEALRAPVTGCPWDQKQDFSSIASYTIEEAYEVADAIGRDDLAGLKDELGDLLLQVTYHAQIAEEQDAFAFADVVDSICRKMIRRHPHVFGNAEAKRENDVMDIWNRIKAEEKAAKPNREPQRLLDEVPVVFPALQRAVKLQSKAARVGFDWAEVKPVFDKIDEELDELKGAVSIGEPSSSKAKIEEEFGDVLFVLANAARHLDIDPEKALHAANAKFTRRFNHIEDQLAAAGTLFEDATLEEMDRFWDEAKALEKSG